MRTGLGPTQCGKEHARQNRDDRDDHQQFDQRETPFSARGQRGGRACDRRPDAGRCCAEGQGGAMGGDVHGKDNMRMADAVPSMVGSLLA